MTDSSPGPSSAVTLIACQQKRNIKLCIICKKAKDSNGSIKLTSTSDGRDKVVKTSKLLSDNVLFNLSESELSAIQYHVNSCYGRYIKSGERFAQKQATEKRPADNQASPKEIASPSSHIKRRKVTERHSLSIKDKPCIICNHLKRKNVTDRYRMCEKANAKNFINAYNFFKDDVYTRCAMYKMEGDIFAADIMYHHTCLVAYLKKFKTSVQDILSYEEEDISNTEDMKIVFYEVVQTLELDVHGYAISDVRDMMNQKIEDRNIGTSLSFYHLL